MVHSFCSSIFRSTSHPPRREVGTVGVTSPLFDVDKAFKALAEEAEDPEAYVELLERFTKARMGVWWMMLLMDDAVDGWWLMVDDLWLWSMIMIYDYDYDDDVDDDDDDDDVNWILQHLRKQWDDFWAGGLPMPLRIAAGWSLTVTLHWIFWFIFSLIWNGSKPMKYIEIPYLGGWNLHKCHKSQRFFGLWAPFVQNDQGITRADADAYSSIFSMNSAAATSPQAVILPVDHGCCWNQENPRNMLQIFLLRVPWGFSARSTLIKHLRSRRVDLGGHQGCQY